jgi:hypothetical protein
MPSEKGRRSLRSSNIDVFWNWKVAVIHCQWLLRFKFFAFMEFRDFLRFRSHFIPP